MVLNRAQSYRFLESWSECLQDCNTCIQLDPTSFKAHYLKGISLANLAKETEKGKSKSNWKGMIEEAAASLQTALFLDQSKNESAAREDILAVLSKVKAYEMLRTKQEKKKELEETEEFLKSTLSSNSASKSLFKDLSLIIADYKTSLLQADGFLEPPSSLQCGLTLDVFKDPCTTSSGQTYEKDLIIAHMNKKGAIDPTTRKPIQDGILVINKVIKEASDDWKLRHPQYVLGDAAEDYRNMKIP